MNFYYTLPKVEHGSQQPQGKPRLGVDIGRVIIRSDTDDPDRNIFGADFLLSPEVEGALEALRELNVSGRWDQIHLVSKCKPPVQERTRLWLDKHDFYIKTGIERENVHYCLERFEKGIIAANLALTHFVDDRLDVLQSMPEGVGTRVLFNPEFGDSTAPMGMIIAKNWDEVKKHIKK